MENIGKYQITGELGSGGFGRVYKALDPTVGRVVAIKVLNVQDDPAMVMRFEAEAKTSANLQHKNIVIVHEFGEQNRKQFLVMEYLSGRNLQEIINEGVAIAPLDKLMIMSEVAQGLQFAHEHGVVHRDVKPANIMRLSDGSVKIMDFGIARLMRSANTRLTQAGIMIGTPQYMAPEQFTSDTADEKCDVWAYGVVFYEFLTGHNPFHGENAPQMIFRVTAEEPPPISTQLPGLPRGLDPILRRLLAKSRDERYSSLEDVRFDLEPVILELKRAQVEDLLRSAAALIQDERLDEALTVVRRILESDQSNPQARKWRRELPDRIRLQSLQVRVKALAEQAEADAARRDYHAALEKFGEAVRLDRSNPQLRARMDEIAAEQERVDRAAGLVSEARVEYEQNALTGAFDHANEAARADPANSDAAVLLFQIREAIERRDEEAQRKAALSKAKGLILVQAYESAIAVLEELAKKHPEDEETRDKLEEAKRLQSAFEAQRKTDAAILESRDLIRRSLYQRAIEELEALDQDIPQKGQVSDLLAYAREQLELEKRAAELEELIRQATEAPPGDFDLRLSLADRALNLAPGNEKALRLRKSVLAARQFDQEDRAARRSVQECRALLLGGKLDEAVAACSDLKAKHPDHPSVIELDQDIERLVRERRERKERELQARVRDAERLLDQGRPGDATRLLQTLTVQYPGERIFAPLLERAIGIEREQSKRDAVQAALSRSRELAAGKRWDQALGELERALADWPDSPELLEEQARVLRSKATEEAFEGIQQRIARHELEAAIAVADSILVRFPGEARIVELREQGRKQLEFERLLKDAENLVFQGEFDRAAPVVNDLLRRVPGDPNAQRLKETIQRKQKRRQDFATAEQLGKRLEFQKAHDLVIRILLEDPEDAAAGALLKSIERDSLAHQRRQRIERARADAAEKSKHRQFAAALQLLETIAREFPDEEGLQDDLRRTREAQAQFERKEACARGRAELAALMKQRRFEDAIEKARQLAAGFPEEPFQQDLQAAIAARELRDRRLQVDAEIAEIEKLFHQGDAASVRARAEALLTSGEEPRARELLNWARKSLSELKVIKRKAAGPLRDWRWIAAALAVPIALFVIWKIWPPAQAVVGELRIQPVELSFSYRRGDPVSPPQSVQLTGTPTGETWVAAASASWFKATPTERIGDGPISVQVDPRKLSVGEHSGVVTVSAKRASVRPVTATIRLDVIAEASIPEPQPETKKQGTPTPDDTAPGAKGTKKETPLVAEAPKKVAIPGRGSPADSASKGGDGKKNGSGQPEGAGAGQTQPLTNPQVLTNPPPSTAAPEPIVDCKSLSYYGVHSSMVQWSGLLPPGQAVTIDRHNAVVAGPAGRVGGTHLPGCEVTVKAITQGIEITDLPTLANQYGRVTLKNSSPSPVTNPSFQWTVK
jgi:serine/threonine-protein kinase